MYIGLIIIGTGARVLIEQLHPLMQTEGISSAVGLLKHMKGAYGVAASTVTDNSMIAAVEALKSQFLLAVVAAGGLAIAMTIASTSSWIYAKNALGSNHWFFLSDPANKISTPHQFYWIFIGYFFFIIVSLLTPKNDEEIIQKYCRDLRPEVY
ncbi:MAG: hypothetical protein U9P10_00915 [Thermodesulfobacteriota bacterium]|nr:hypothetical protein [Thermodesulfobacteriota bacterium]